MFAYCYNLPISKCDNWGFAAYYIGLGGNITAIAGASISIQFSVDDYGNMAFQWSYSGKLVDGTAHAGIFDVGVNVMGAAVWSADTIYDLEGQTTVGGFSGGPLKYGGINVLWLPRYSTKDFVSGIELSGGVGAGIDMHAVSTETRTIVVTRPKTPLKPGSAVIISSSKYLVCYSCGCPHIRLGNA